MKTAKHLIIATAFLFALPSMAQTENCGVTAALQLTPPTCGEYANGAVLITASGGVGPYTYYLNGVVSSSNPTGLVAGSYNYWVVDRQNCWKKGDFYLACEPPKDNCEYRTQTQGGWGATPHGNNPAKYLQNNFATCLPNGVTIGCATGNTLTLTTSTAVKDFLPSGSTPSMLPSTMVNPGGGYSNVLAGQLVAATINISLDACMPGFSISSGWSGDLTYLYGPFTGWTVSQVVNAANQFIGGCGGSYTASQLNDALAMFNENYVGGTMDNGNFNCAEGGKEVKKSVVASSVAELDLYPNPVSSALTLDLQLAEVGNGVLVVTDLMGRVVMEQTLSVTDAGLRRVVLNVDGLTSGTYAITLTFNDQRRTKRFVVSK